MLAVDIDVLDELCFHTVICLNNRLFLGWGYVELKDDGILPHTHIANVLVWDFALFNTEIVINDSLDSTITKAAENIFRFIRFDDVLRFFEGQVMAFEFALIEYGHCIAVVQ